MELYFGEIYLATAYKMIITLIIFIISIIISTIIKIITKHEETKKINIPEVKKKTRSRTSAIINIFLVFGSLIIAPLTYVYFPSIELAFEKNNATMVKQIIYVNRVEGSNGDSLIAENGIEYYVPHESEFVFPFKLIQELTGEYCEITYYEKSKLLSNILVVDDLSMIGIELSPEEVEGLNIPDYPGDEPDKNPISHWKWKGFCGEGENCGYWENQITGEKLNPDINYDQPGGPHWDYTDANGQRYRLFSDGRVYKMNGF